MAYFDLGSYSRKVTTSSPEAQLWFDRGLNWLFGFNHAEAIKCFGRRWSTIPAAPWRTGASPTRPGRTTTCPGISTTRRPAEGAGGSL